VKCDWLKYDWLKYNWFKCDWFKCDWFRSAWLERPHGARLLACLVLAAGPAAASSLDPRQALPGQSPDIVGEAVDPDTGETLYLEQHYCTDDALRCSVYYLRPNDELIASKQINYQPSLQAPELLFRDFRTDRETTISPTGGGQVVDAGFDNFVRLQWRELAGGEEVKFPFRMVGRDDPIAMRANRESDCETGRLCLQIRLDSWLLGSLIDPIELTYDERSRRLLRFEGISNLKNDKGRSQKVKILYRYFDGDSGAENTASADDSLPVPTSSPPGDAG
jgi:hypothetical protein